MSHLRQVSSAFNKMSWYTFLISQQKQIADLLLINPMVAFSLILYNWLIPLFYCY